MRWMVNSAMVSGKGGIIFFVLVAWLAACSTPTDNRITLMPVKTGLPAITSPVPSGTYTLPASRAVAQVTSTPINIPHTVTPDGGSRLESVAFSPWDLVLALSWSPDGRLLAISAGGVVHLFDPLIQKEVGVLDAGSWVNRIAFQPGDGSGLVALACRDGSLQLWDYQEGKRLCSLTAHNKGANSLAFSPDGRGLASTGNDAMVRLWDVSLINESCDLPLLAEMIGGAYAVPDVAFSPDGNMVASIDIHLIRLRDPATQRLIRTMHGETSLFDIEFSPDGSSLAVGALQNKILLFDPQSGEAAKTLVDEDKPKAFIWSVAFSPDGRWLAGGGNDGVIRLWEVHSGELYQRLGSHERAVTSLAFSPDGKWLASGGLDAVVKLWMIDD